MNTRLERVNQLIRDAIAEILRRDITDPLIGFVTIMEAEVSPDLRHAKVYFSVLGTPEQVQDSTKGLLRARKHINALLADHIDLRFVPKIRFVYDETSAKAQRMEALLKEEHEQLAADLARHAAEDAAAAAAAAAAPDEVEEVAAEDFDDEFGDEALEDEDFDDEDEDDDDNKDEQG
jgi:ribosome-binding factor A